MHWRDEIILKLPSPHDDEPRDLRQDILDELEDHLDCAMQRELRRVDDEQVARRRVLDRFGNPAKIARQLWLDAMKETIMNQRILIGTNITLAVLVLAMFITVLMALRQNQRFHDSLVEQLAAITAASPVTSPHEIAAFSWPRAIITIEATDLRDEEFRVEVIGEPYNPGERLTLREGLTDGHAVFGPMRPGRYRLRAYGPETTHYETALVIAPGSDHELTIQWPEHQPQPAEVAINLALPEEVLQFDPVMVVWFRTRPADSPEGWTWTPAYAIIDRHQRALMTELGPSPVKFGHPLGGLIDFVGDATSWPREYQVHRERLELQETVAIDAALIYEAHSLEVLVPYGENGEEVQWKSIPHQGNPFLGGNAVYRSGPDEHAEGVWNLQPTQAVYDLLRRTVYHTMELPLPEELEPSRRRDGR